MGRITETQAAVAIVTMVMVKLVELWPRNKYTLIVFANVALEATLS